MNNIRALLLAAGLGSRLKPYTDYWPKCLMPISGRPLLEYWLSTLYEMGLYKVLVNLHHHSRIVEGFLRRPDFSSWVSTVTERELLGTAGTLRGNLEFFQFSTGLLIHADNLCQCDFSKFVQYHLTRRPRDTVITMMTFKADNPQDCGIVEVDDQGIVREFYEKESAPPGDLANGAVYLLEPEVLFWIKNNPTKSDFSNDVLPEFIGRIATWRNDGIHIDIGTIKSLKAAQNEVVIPPRWDIADSWSEQFRQDLIHKHLATSDG